VYSTKESYIAIIYSLTVQTRCQCEPVVRTVTERDDSHCCESSEERQDAIIVLSQVYLSNQPANVCTLGEYCKITVVRVCSITRATVFGSERLYTETYGRRDNGRTSCKTRLSCAAINRYHLCSSTRRHPGIVLTFPAHRRRRPSSVGLGR